MTTQKDIFKNPSEIDNKILNKFLENNGFKNAMDYRNKFAERQRFIDDAERKRINRWNNGTRSPFDDNENCPQYCEVFIGENIIGSPTLLLLFEEVENMKPNNPGSEFKCKNPRQEFIDKYHQFRLERNKQYRIDVKTAHLIGDRWQFGIRFNNNVDYFLLIALDKDKMWLIHKYQIIRGKKFWERNSLWVTNKPYNLEEFENYDIKYILEKLDIGK